MKALFITEPGRTEIRDIDEPTPAQGEVLLRVRMVGLCGSDLSSYLGKLPLVTYPRIPGHEIAATIESVGVDVGWNLKPGTNVTLSPYTTCGVCPSCRNDRPNACRDNQTMGVQREGALTPYITAPAEKLYMSSRLSLQEIRVL